MITFTDKIADYIYSNQLDHKNLTIVLPSERAKKYVAASIFDKYRKPVAAPAMITMDAWIRQHTEKTVIDKTRALIRLFDVQLKTAQKDEDRSFDEFLEWGAILLSDFDELDRYLIEAATIFKVLHNIKELEYWRIDAEEDYKLSDARKRFLEFWDRLPFYYKELNESLGKTGATYMGAAYKELAGNIAVLFRENKNAHFLFAGFNAFSQAEMSIVKQLHQMGRGHVLVDADAFYLNDKNHEAGEFIRKQIKGLGVKELPVVENRLLEKKMRIEVVECAQLTGQVKVASSRLLELPEHEIAQTLVLLADESLIGPFLKNIPKKVGKTNVTLGMPMKGTAVKNWVDILFSIQETKNRFNSSAYYHNDLKRLLNHPFFIACLNADEKELLQKLEETIIQKNWIFIAPKQILLGKKLEKIIEIAGVNWKRDWKIAMHQIRSLNRILFSEFSEENQFERALIHSFDNALIEFQNIVSEGLPEMSLRSFRGLFTQHWSNKGIAYHGNPVDGLQVMGVLETRLLDFKHIICLGLNEGMMPPTNPIQSMFPMDLRRYSGLPVPRDKQGLFAHHFYRLLHACDHLLVTYSGTKESIGSNERSRYLQQIEKELVRRNPKISWEFSYYNIPMEEDRHVDLRSVQKDPQILAKMDELFERSASFSALNKYHKCPLDFYYRYVLEFGEEDVVEEELESSTFGTILHAAFEALYTKHAKYTKEGELNPGGGLPLRVSDIDEMLVKIEPIIRELFTAYFNGDQDAFSFGKNYLSYKMAVDMARQFLKEERTFIAAPNTVIIHSLEKNIKVPIGFTIHGQEKNIRLNGTIDRVDEVNGKIRLVDYKTGSCKDEDVRLKQETNRTKNSELKLNLDVKHIMQLLMYCYIYYRDTNTYPDTAGIFSMIRLKNGLCTMDLLDKTVPEMMEKFPEWLQELFEELYDVNIPFEHKDRGEYSYCTYCG